MRAVTLAWAALAVLALIVFATAAFVYFGVYNIAATEQHTTPVYWLIQAAMTRSVHMRSSSVRVPDLASSALMESGFRIYDAHCARCHGAPGVAPDAFALGMTPVPANLAETGRVWNAADIYWVVKYGIKMTGMPAWKYRIADDEIWGVVAFVKSRLPYLSPAEYRAASRHIEKKTSDVAGRTSAPATANATEGRRVMQQYGCATCHDIPGVTGAKKHVGPALKGMAGRSYIAGVLVNTPENIVAWLMWPQKIDPLSAMPNLGVNEKDARNMAAYLETLR